MKLNDNRCQDKIMRQEYYYQHMTKGEQSAYRSMLDGFEAIAPEFPVLNLGGRELVFQASSGSSLNLLCGGI